MSPHEQHRLCAATSTVVLECARTRPTNTKSRCTRTNHMAKLAARSGSRYELQHHAERRHGENGGSRAARIVDVCSGGGEREPPGKQPKWQGYGQTCAVSARAAPRDRRSEPPIGTRARRPSAECRRSPLSRPLARSTLSQIKRKLMSAATAPTHAPPSSHRRSDDLRQRRGHSARNRGAARMEPDSWSSPWGKRRGS